MPVGAVACKHPIPEPFVWDESFKVFYTNLDDEHKKLFQGVFGLNENKNEAARKQLEGVVAEHFEDEERMMKAANFSDYDKHKASHDEFLCNVRGLQGKHIDSNVIQYATTWLVSHIKDTDMKYKGKL